MMSIKLRFYSNMQITMLLLLFLLFVDGMSGAETDISVMEGDSVTLHTDLTQILNDQTITWSFGPKRSVISQITRPNGCTSFFVTDVERFRGRLQVDQITGSLTIRNTRIRHTGPYELEISRGGTIHTYKTFNVTVQRVINGTGGVKLVSVKEGESVTLDPNLTQIHRDDLMLWRIGHKSILLATVDAETNESSLYDADGRFRDRLKLNNQTGSLTIRNTRTTDSGLYQLQIRGRESSQLFILTVNRTGLSPCEVALIVINVLILAVAGVAGLIYYRHTISEILNQTWSVITGEDITRTNEKMMFEGDNLLRSTRTEHSGPYMLYDIESRSAEQIFFVTVNENVKVNLVKYGDSVTLKPDPEIQRDDQMLWMFGDQDILIAQVKAGTGETYGGADERFRGRLELDETTGSLTIRNILLQHTGLYKLQIISRSGGILTKKFRVSMQNSSVKRENESETVEMSLLGEKVPDAVNEQERRRSL
ncbi:uncharacterized protein LOC113099024 isoform X2 [Carassius auratus]|uniref:Uncharacterized protein LOC113099024 isoform X2 n=1 Tax=Carassius auratus TaxID=7957 RepID=A0A6P6PHJ0_CARAU|nr:uncharacterized protein LOC113099024 isoform X2 [Carassius auratus]